MSIEYLIYFLDFALLRLSHRNAWDNMLQEYSENVIRWFSEQILVSNILVIQS